MLFNYYSLDDLKFFDFQTDNGSLVVDEVKFFDKPLYRNGFTVIQLIHTNSPLELINILKINDVAGHQISSIRIKGEETANV